MKITVVTSSRADWNSTGMVVKALKDSPAFAVSVLAMAASGSALDALDAAMREDGIEADIRRSLNLTRDDPVNLAAAAGDACRFAGEALYALKPDRVFLPGDRWEMAQVAISAVLSGIPIAHLAGGDKTTGSFDDIFRDIITRCADLHFVTNWWAEERLIDDFAISGSNVHNVGSPAIDRIKSMPLMGEDDLICWLDHSMPRLSRPFIIVNWQPETRSDNPNKGLVEIIDALPEDGRTALFIDQNDDRYGKEAREIIIREMGQTPRSFPPKVYLSMLSHCDCLVGNSSSGIYEAPFLGVKVVNVGDRQSGRSRWLGGVENVQLADGKLIRESIARALSNKASYFSGTMFGDGRACDKIVKVLHEL